MVTGLVAAMTLMSQATAATGAACNRDYGAVLDKTVTATLTAVKGNDANGFLAVVSPDGVTIGQESPILGYAALAAQFKMKSGRYCDLFTCGGKAGGLHHLFVAGHIDKSIDTKHGLATVTINANSNDELDLNYKYNPARCVWELTGIGSV